MDAYEVALTFPSPFSDPFTVAFMYSVTVGLFSAVSIAIVLACILPTMPLLNFALVSLLPQSRLLRRLYSLLA
jgi:hypothetical protein